MLSIKNVTKSFNGLIAVNSISFNVERGKIYGLLGPNGAGKTTTIRMILDIIKPDSGEITFTEPEWKGNYKRYIGYLPEERGLYQKSKLKDTIIYFSTLKGISKRLARERADYWLHRFELS
ncbi:MAG: ABC transporter ATP-binding protein, partial [Fidelibacterota bacterium]